MNYQMSASLAENLAYFLLVIWGNCVFTPIMGARVSGDPNFGFCTTYQQPLQVSGLYTYLMPKWAIQKNDAKKKKKINNRKKNNLDKTLHHCGSVIF